VISRDEIAQDAYLNDELVYHGPFRRETLEGLVSTVARAQEGPGFGELPLLWIHGTGDMLVPYDPTREVIEKLAGPGTEKTPCEVARDGLFDAGNSDDVRTDVFDLMHRTMDK